jgi:CRP-like cAMP-binding protein
MVHLDKGETIASATMPEQSLYIIVSGILHTFSSHQGEDKTIRFLSAGDAILCYNTRKHSVKTLTRCVAYYISEDEIEELCATSITFSNLVRQLMEYQFYFKEEMNVNMRKLTIREKYLSLLTEIPDILYRVPLKYITHYLGADVTSLGYLAGSQK